MKILQEVDNITFYQDSNHDERGQNKSEPFVFAGLIVALLIVAFILHAVGCTALICH